tara:strand:- start:3667 stop:4932 length:1266 start_codon:yes stop_codon:yes gene_type:complete
MAVPGLMGGDVPDWLADWLTGQGFLSSNSQTSAPNGLLQQSKAIFDSLGKKPKEIFPQDNEGGSPVGDPEPINFNALTPEEVANVARTGFKNDTEKNLAWGISLIPGGEAFLNLAILGNKNSSMEYINQQLELLDNDPAVDDANTELSRIHNETRDLYNKVRDEVSIGHITTDPIKGGENLLKQVAKIPGELLSIPKKVVGKVTGLFDTSTYSPTLGYSDKQIEEARKMGLEGIDPSPDKGQSRHPSSPSSYTIQPQPVLEQVINEIGPPMNLTPRSETFKGPDIFNPVIDKGYKDYTSQKAIADRNRGLWDALVREDYHRDPRNENPWGPYGSGGNIHKSPYVETFQKLAPKQKVLGPFAAIPIEEGPVESIVNNNITLSDIYSSEDERAMQQEIVNEMLGDNMGGFGGEGIGDDYTGWT